MKRNWQQQLQRKLEDFQTACAAGASSTGARRAWLEGYLSGLFLSEKLSITAYGEQLAQVIDIEEQAQKQRKVT